MLYEIVNPSDPYTIKAESLDVAFVACLMLGNGQYAFGPLESAGVKIPLFLFGGLADCEAWSTEHLHEEFESVIKRVTTDPLKIAELAACFESCLIGRFKERETYRAGLELIDDPAKRDEWRARWHDTRRSSLNDIGGRAYEMASKLRTGIQNPVIPAPPQVFTT
jgi:hypothetical protein